MGKLEEELLTIRTQVLEETDKGAILEISFLGVHDHTWPYGDKIKSLVKKEIREIKPAAVVFNFIDYRYDFGNEIADPVLAAALASEHNTNLPFAIIAEGTTSRALKSLFGAAKLDAVLSCEFFDNVGNGCAFLKRMLSRVDPA